MRIGYSKYLTGVIFVGMVLHLPRTGGNWWTTGTGGGLVITLKVDGVGSSYKWWC